MKHQSKLLKKDYVIKDNPEYLIFNNAFINEAYGYEDITYYDHLHGGVSFNLHGVLRNKLAAFSFTNVPSLKITKILFSLKELAASTILDIHVDYSNGDLKISLSSRGNNHRIETYSDIHYNIHYTVYYLLRDMREVLQNLIEKDLIRDGVM